MKLCTKCNKNKDLGRFYKDNSSKDKLARYCKDCCLVYARSEYTNRKEARVKAAPRVRSYQLRRVYGITSEQYNEMFERQQGCCLICDRHQNEFTRKLAVDHDHVTGEIRGLLCSGCNTGLGFFKDSVDLLEKAIKYLKKGPNRLYET